MHGSILKQLNNGKPRRAEARREPAGEAKPDVCALSDCEAGAYCTVGLVKLQLGASIACSVCLPVSNQKNVKFKLVYLSDPCVWVGQINNLHLG